MSGRNGTAGRRGGRETAPAPVYDEDALKRFTWLISRLAKVTNERDELKALVKQLKARVKHAEARSRSLAKDVLRLDERLHGGKRHYTGGRVTAPEKAAILAKYGFMTKMGEPPTRYFVYRLYRFPDHAPSWYAEWFDEEWFTDRYISRGEFERRVEEASRQRDADEQRRKAIT